MAELRKFSAGWSEGRYFDRWMAVHFIGGVTGAFSNVFFALTTANVYLVGLAVMVAWEVVEYIAGIRESQENRVLDIVVGMLGVVIALLIAGWISPNWERGAFVVSGVGFGLGGYFGWAARRKRRQGK